MNIVIIGAAHPYRGGIAALNERLATTLQEQGHSVTICTFKLQYPNFLFPGKTQLSSESPPVNLKILRLVNSVNPLNWYSAARKIRSLNPDLIIVRFWLPFFGPAFGTILRRVKSKIKVPVIGIIDNMIPHESRVGDRAFSKYFVKPVDGFIAMSRSVLDDITQFNNSKPKIYTPHPIYDHYGIVESRESALQKLGLDPDFRYALFFGLIRDYKGLDLLLEAFSKESVMRLNIKLIIAGEYYSNREKYQTLIKQYGLENRVIETNSFIADSAVADYFNAADVIAQPYKSATQSGVTQIAYHFNKPMIVTNVGGLPEICPDGVVGYIAEPNGEDIAKALVKFFTDTDQDIMRSNIIEEKKKYAWSVLTDKVFELYNKIKSE